MRIGIFDSGLGGLIVAKAIARAMPEYDYVYLGDTKRVPYGNRSHETVFQFAEEGISHLFEKENCAIVIVACNTVSARALRRLQKKYPKRKILGVLIPLAEECAKFEKIGVLATRGTVISSAFPREIKKINRQVKIFQNPAPMLVPLAEEGETKNALPFLKKYLQPILTKKPNAIALGCTHYPIFKKEIKKLAGKNIKILSQDEIVPKKLKNYFIRHPEIAKKLSKRKQTPKGSKASYGARILVTDLTQSVQNLSRNWFGIVKPRLINL